MDSGCVRIFWCDPRGRIRWQLGSVRVTLAAVGWARLLRWSWGGTSFPGASTSSQAHCSFSRDQATPSHHQHCSTAAGHQLHCSVNIITGVVVWYLYAADVLKWQLSWRVETRLEELVPGGGWAIWHWHWYRLSFEKWLVLVDNSVPGPVLRCAGYCSCKMLWPWTVFLDYVSRGRSKDTGLAAWLGGATKRQQPAAPTRRDCARPC